MRRMQTEPRRWTGKPRRITAADVAVWLFVFIITAGVLLAGCMLLTLAWPSP